MEIKLGPLAINVGDDGMSSIVASGATGADVGLSSEDIDQLALAFESREREISEMRGERVKPTACWER